MARSRRVKQPAAVVQLEGPQKTLPVSIAALLVAEPVAVAPSNRPPTILVDDDDDDVHISSARDYLQARSISNAILKRQRTGTETGTSAHRPGSRTGKPSQTEGNISKPYERPGTLMIDLTGPASSNDNDCIVISDFVQKKRKPAPSVKAPPPPVELSLTCAICMDKMKEETSTICGHIFCRACLVGAITKQKKCPTCRRKLTNSMTHRIYISGSLRDS